MMMRAKWLAASARVLERETANLPNVRQVRMEYAISTWNLHLPCRSCERRRSQNEPGPAPGKRQPSAETERPVGRPANEYQTSRLLRRRRRPAHSSRPSRVPVPTPTATPRKALWKLNPMDTPAIRAEAQMNGTARLTSRGPREVVMRRPYRRNRRRVTHQMSPARPIARSTGAVVHAVRSLHQAPGPQRATDTPE